MALFNGPSSDGRPRPDAPPAPDQHNIIGRGTVIEGTLRSSGNVHISGTVVGNVEVEGRTVVMPDGVIEGELASTSAEIGGRVRGEVRVEERLVLKGTAAIEGDIRTAKLVIEDGAVFTGRCEMAGLAAPPRPASAEALIPDSAFVPDEEPAPLTAPLPTGRPARRLGGGADPNVAAF